MGKHFRFNEAGEGADVLKLADAIIEPNDYCVLCGACGEVFSPVDDDEKFCPDCQNIEVEVGHDSHF